MQTPPPPPAEVETQHRFPCDQCGADYRYDPATGKLTCDHCGHETQMAQPGPWASNIRELDFKAALQGDIDTAEIETTRVSICPNCAAQVELAGADHAADCPFCATPFVADTGQHRHIKPRALLPFALDERAAKQAMSVVGTVVVCPRRLQEYARKGRKMQGIYVPYWTTCGYKIILSRRTRAGLLRNTHGDARWEIRSTAGAARALVPRIRRVKRFFDDVLVLASRLPKRFMRWNTNQALNTSRAFAPKATPLTWMTDLDMRAHMDRVIAQDVRFDIGGDRQRVHHIDTTVSDVTFKHILLPVWLAAYKYRGKTYRFVVNARTGRVQGERPYSTWKIAMAIVLGLCVAGAVGYLYATNQGG